MTDIFVNKLKGCLQTRLTRHYKHKCSTKSGIIRFICLNFVDLRSFLVDKFTLCKTFHIMKLRLNLVTHVIDILISMLIIYFPIQRNSDMLNLHWTLDRTEACNIFAKSESTDSLESPHSPLSP